MKEKQKRKYDYDNYDNKSNRKLLYNIYMYTLCTTRTWVRAKYDTKKCCTFKIYFVWLMEGQTEDTHIFCNLLRFSSLKGAIKAKNDINDIFVIVLM